MTLGFGHARINSVATLSLRVIPARACSERQSKETGIAIGYVILNDEQSQNSLQINIVHNR